VARPLSVVEVALCHRLTYSHGAIMCSQVSPTCEHLKIKILPSWFSHALIYFRLSVPILIGTLIEYLTAVQGEESTPYKYVALFVLATFLSTFFYHYYLFAVQRIGMDIRIALSFLIYEKVSKILPLCKIQLQFSSFANTSISRS